MKKEILIIIYLIICLHSFSQNSLSPSIVANINIGTDKSELGYLTDMFIPGAGNPKPIDYIISTENIYIYDWANSRIAQYNMNFEYLKEIKGKKIFGFMYGMKIDELGNLYIKYGNGINKFDNNSKFIYFVSDNKLSETVQTSKNYFPYNGFLFYYDDNFRLQSLDVSGEKMEQERITELHNQAIQQSQNLSRANTAFDYQIVNEFNNKKEKLFFKGNQLYINDKVKYLEYISFMQDKIKVLKTRQIAQGKSIIGKDYVMVELLGYDDANNAYWQSDKSILVISQFGEIVENVAYDPNIMTNPKIAPNGDIYFWDVKPEGVTFYKITRQW